MKRDDVDFQAFARLRGREGKKAVTWVMLASLVLFLAGLILLLNENGWADAVAPQDLPLPHVGYIINHTRHTVSVPSANSQGTYLIEPGGRMEYPFWSPDVDFTAYINGKEFYCHKFAPIPNSYTYMCKSYDFLVELTEPAPAYRPACGNKLKYRIRKPRRSHTPTVKG
jgi:hypothetical protein